MFKTTCRKKLCGDIQAHNDGPHVWWQCCDHEDETLTRGNQWVMQHSPAHRRRDQPTHTFHALESSTHQLSATVW